MVLTDQPFWQVLLKHEMFERLVQWAVELSEFDIQYQTRPAIKSQVLADFVIECIVPSGDSEVEQEEIHSNKPMPSIQPWILYIDRSSTLSTSRVRIILISPNNVTIDTTRKYYFSDRKIDC